MMFVTTTTMSLVGLAWLTFSAMALLVWSSVP